jgi:hypothetical protein
MCAGRPLFRQNKKFANRTFMGWEDVLLGGFFFSNKSSPANRKKDNFKHFEKFKIKNLKVLNMQQFMI